MHVVSVGMVWLPGLVEGFIQEKTMGRMNIKSYLLSVLMLLVCAAGGWAENTPPDTAAKPAAKPAAASFQISRMTNSISTDKR